MWWKVETHRKTLLGRLVCPAGERDCSYDMQLLNAVCLSVSDRQRNNLSDNGPISQQPIFQEVLYPGNMVIGLHKWTIGICHYSDSLPIF